ncbi:hypothetical protein J2W56_000233 [Nocardia kruczakiae]|uniref:Short subunit dehydrogenase n=1 Tax=Nocardia kruczakiae TaxID=261477 RepID=A0ABU1X7I5_9NOCA|nr:SDR family NAD(P)-dependent oxidoreductase [Nocardia kruczakiae]MDR7166515.1 hypothetical protein [Nocardia kruczakiae]
MPAYPLAGRTMVVSGASRGIGLAIAVAAATRGANIVLLAKTAQPHPKLPGTVHSAVAEIEAAGGKAVAVVGDVRREEDVRRAARTAVDRFGGIDICVNNASAIAVNCLWPQTYIATSAVANMADGSALLDSARDPAIMGDAAAEILSRPAKYTTGNCYIDAEVLIESGVCDLSGYGGGERPIPDLFLD